MTSTEPYDLARAEIVTSVSKGCGFKGDALRRVCLTMFDGRSSGSGGIGVETWAFQPERAELATLWYAMVDGS